MHLYEVPRDPAAIQDRWQALSTRADDADAARRLQAAGTFDAEQDGHLISGPPLTPQEWAELLALGRAMAEYYDHPARVDSAVRVGGTDWQMVADALGTTPDAARAAYRDWATMQRGLNRTLAAEGSALAASVGLTPDDYAEALALADGDGAVAEEEDTADADADDVVVRAADRAAAVRALVATGRDRRDLEDRTRRAVLNARAAGVPVRAVAEYAAIAPDTVSRWVTDRGRELLAEGHDVDAVAAATGARVQTVARWAARKTERPAD